MVTDGHISVVHSLAGTVDGLSTADAALRRTFSLAGQSDGIGTAVSALRRTFSLAGTSDGIGTGVSALTVTASDPSGLNLSIWNRASYSGSPWGGTASA